MTWRLVGEQLVYSILFHNVDQNSSHQQIDIYKMVVEFGQGGGRKENDNCKKMQ